MEYTHRIEGLTYYWSRLGEPAFGTVGCEGDAYPRRGLRVRIIRESTQRFAKGQSRVLVQSEPTDRLPDGGFAWVSAPFMLTEMEYVA